MPAASVVFYREDDGSAPALDWLGGIEKKAQAKCIAKIERLRQLGHELRRPEADILRDGIHELRVGLRHVNYRLLYFFSGRSAVVISHGLTKEAEVPAAEIDRAVECMAKFKAAPEKHTYTE